ncbi:hypothetical protein GCM10009716_24870 [Streptomyces sodiiphilus]|uniref:Uncharacterized protein n=1 Tax=Streptomyces sodiiphilus TaxID=226217 RepID=A0ABP5AKY7_9ACTN
MAPAATAPAATDTGALKNPSGTCMPHSLSAKTHPDLITHHSNAQLQAIRKSAPAAKRPEGERTGSGRPGGATGPPHRRAPTLDERAHAARSNSRPYRGCRRPRPEGHT